MKVRLEAIHISKTKLFPDKKGRDHPRKVLDSVDMAVHEGEVFVILGPTGAGKTTLLRMFNRLEVPDSGNVLFDGGSTEEWDVLELRRKIGLVFQSPALLADYVRDDILYGPKLRGNPDGGLAGELAKRVGLPEHLLSRQTEELSAGERQKVSIARALANRPEILLMDEPSSAQDPSSKSNLEEFIREFVASGLTVVLVTHDVAQAQRLADRVLLLVDGKGVLEGARDEVFGEGAPEIARKFIEGTFRTGER
jgi:putative ABC transport system ATP-binding protein